MTRRIIPSLLAVLLIFQMVAVPFASAFAVNMLVAECNHAGTVHPWHADNCSDAGDGSSPTKGHPQHAPDHRRHCVHVVPSVSIAGDCISVARVGQRAQVIDGRLAGPAYPAPYFDVLRPPN